MAEEVKVAEVAAPETENTAAAAAPRQRSKSGRYIPSGIAYILATFNNTKVTFTDLHGNVISWSTGGKNGFKGSRKSTAYAAQVIAGDAAKKAQLLGMKEVEVRIKGPGAGRESAVRGIAAAGMEISVIKDITPVPHNGCRPRNVAASDVMPQVRHLCGKFGLNHVSADTSNFLEDKSYEFINRISDAQIDRCR